MLAEAMADAKVSIDCFSPSSNNPSHPTPGIQLHKWVFNNLSILSVKDDIRKRKISKEQRPTGAGKSSPTSGKTDDDSDDDNAGVYEALWDAISPPVPQRTVSIQGRDVRKIQQRLYHIEDFNLLKVLGKGSFGKVKWFCLNSFSQFLNSCFFKYFTCNPLIL